MDLIHIVMNFRNYQNSIALNDWVIDEFLFAKTIKLHVWDESAVERSSFEEAKNLASIFFVIYLWIY